MQNTGSIKDERTAKINKRKIDKTETNMPGLTHQGLTHVWNGTDLL
jgi:hypothetical protein